MLEHCSGYLQQKLREAIGDDILGNPPLVFITLKELKGCAASRAGAVMIGRDTITLNGKPMRNLETGADDLRLFDRELLFDVVIGGEDQTSLDAAFTRFLSSLDRGITRDGHYIALEISAPAEWVDQKDSVINAQIAVELPIIFTGGVYAAMQTIKLKEITIERTDQHGS